MVASEAILWASQRIAAVSGVHQMGWKFAVAHVGYRKQENDIPMIQ